MAYRVLAVICGFTVLCMAMSLPIDTTNNSTTAIALDSTGANQTVVVMASSPAVVQVATLTDAAPPNETFGELKAASAPINISADAHPVEVLNGSLPVPADASKSQEAKLDETPVTSTNHSAEENSTLSSSDIAIMPVAVVSDTAPNATVASNVTVTQNATVSNQTVNIPDSVTTICTSSAPCGVIQLPGNSSLLAPSIPDFVNNSTTSLGIVPDHIDANSSANIDDHPVKQVRELAPSNDTAATATVSSSNTSTSMPVITAAMEGVLTTEASTGAVSASSSAATSEAFSIEPVFPANTSTGSGSETTPSSSTMALSEAFSIEPVFPATQTSGQSNESSSVSNEPRVLQDNTATSEASASSGESASTMATSEAFSVVPVFPAAHGSGDSTSNDSSLAVTTASSASGSSEAFSIEPVFPTSVGTGNSSAESQDMKQSEQQPAKQTRELPLSNGMSAGPDTAGSTVDTTGNATASVGSANSTVGVPVDSSSATTSQSPANTVAPAETLLASGTEVDNSTTILSGPSSEATTSSSAMVMSNETMVGVTGELPLDESSSIAPPMASLNESTSFQSNTSAPAVPLVSTNSTTEAQGNVSPPERTNSDQIEAMFGPSSVAIPPVQSQSGMPPPPPAIGQAIRKAREFSESNATAEATTQSTDVTATSEESHSASSQSVADMTTHEVSGSSEATSESSMTTGAQLSSTEATVLGATVSDQNSSKTDATGSSEEPHMGSTEASSSLPTSEANSTGSSANAQPGTTESMPLLTQETGNATSEAKGTESPTSGQPATTEIMPLAMQEPSNATNEAHRTESPTSMQPATTESMPAAAQETSNETSSHGSANSLDATLLGALSKTPDQDSSAPKETRQFQNGAAVANSAVQGVATLNAQLFGVQFTPHFRTINGKSAQVPDAFSALDDLRGKVRLEADTAAEIIATARAGADYPNLSDVPVTSFSCEKVNQPGFYADTDPQSRCQVIRRCDANDIAWAYLCPNATVFNQITLTCDWFFNVDCSRAANYYDYSNSRLYQEGLVLLDTPLSIPAAVGSNFNNGLNQNQQGNSFNQNQQGNSFNQNQQGNSFNQNQNQG